MQLFITREEIEEGINKFAGLINSTDAKPEVIICVLPEALFLFSDLVKRLEFDFEIEFIKPKEDYIFKIGDVVLAGKRVLVIGNIIGTGETLMHALAYLKSLNCAKINCVYLLKRHGVDLHLFTRHGVGVGFHKEVPTYGWLVGYGLNDYRGYKGNLEDIYIA